MKQFLAVFLGSADAVKTARADMSDDMKRRMQEGMMAWGKWVEDHKGAIVNGGSPLGKTKRVDTNGVSDITNEMGAWVVVQAETHDEAAQMFVGHPHYTIFPGERIEVMECIEIPKM